MADSSAAQARPKRGPSGCWPKLAGARGRLERDLEEATGEPADRGLSRLAFHMGSSSVTFVYPRLSGERRLWRRLARYPKAVAGRPVVVSSP